MPKGDRELLKADIEDGYTKLANLLLEALAIAKMSGVQKGICLFIVRKTYAWSNKSARISLQEFADACDSKKTYISTQLKELVENKVILRLDNTYGRVPELGINTNISQWQKGFVNAKQLSKNITQGLYKSETQGFRKCETPKAPKANNTAVSEPPKELIKEHINIHSFTAADVYKDPEIYPLLQQISLMINPEWCEFIAGCLNIGMDREVIIAGIRRSLDKGRRTFGGIRERLAAWKKKGILTLDMVKENDKEFFGDKDSSSKFTPLAKSREPTNKRDDDEFLKSLYS